MTYGRARLANPSGDLDGATVSHPAEPVRGYFSEGPLIRPFGAPSPQGEKGPLRPLPEINFAVDVHAINPAMALRVRGGC
jgi:hypothetical protein